METGLILVGLGCVLSFFLFITLTEALNGQRSKEDIFQLSVVIPLVCIFVHFLYLGDYAYRHFVLMGEITSWVISLSYLRSCLNQI